MPQREAVEFLRAVLPDAGWYCAWTKAGNRKYNKFFATIEELAAHIASEDAQGKTVYHACSTYLDPNGVWNERKQKTERRCQANVWGARSLWIDVDAGKENSAYAQAVDAADAVAAFARIVGLPDPLYVGSGYGVHVYWPLREALGAADWLDLARGLRAACTHHGLRCDPVRTADLASILRTPGTHNRKLDTAVPVECGPLVGPYDVEQFDVLLDFSSGMVNRLSVGATSPRNVSVLTQSLIVEPEYAPVSADTVADNCAQLGWLRATRGVTPEPHWYACLGVLSRCQDGEAKAHEWSAAHPNYSYEETQERLARTLQLTGATTCAKLESVNPTGCVGCPFKGRIVSPVSAGRAVSLPEMQTGVDATEAIAEDSTLPELPWPFAWQGTSLVYCKENSDGEASNVLVSSYPIYLDGVGTGEVHGERFAFYFRQWLPYRGWFTITIGAGALVGPSGNSLLSDKGANVHDYKLFLNYVRAATDAYHAHERLMMLYDQCGWKAEDQFLLGTRLYHSEGTELDVLCAPELSTRAQWLGPNGQGTLQGWTEAANALFASGCEPQSFAALCSFAAPLMRFQADNEGGAVVNLVSRGSGSGKTTALTAVYSAWGKEQGLSLINSDTRVAKSVTLGVLGNLPVVYDELGNRDPQVIKDFVVMFTNGRDKMRATHDGTINHTKSYWQTLLISSSNMSMVDLLSHSGGSDAPAYRILEFDCRLPATVVPAKGDKLRKDLQANAGWAGDAYLDYLVQPGVLPWVRQSLEQWTQELWEKAGNRPEQRFWMRTLGAAAVAGAIVNRLDIINFQTSRIVEWALGHLAGYQEAKQEQKEKLSSLESFSQFLSENIDTVLVVQRAWRHGDKVKQIPIQRPRNKVYMRYEVEGQRLVIAEAPFRAWLLAQQVGSREVITDLINAKIIKHPRHYVTLTAGTDVVGAQMACIEIDGSHPAISGVMRAVEPEAVSRTG